MSTKSLSGRLSTVAEFDLIVNDRTIPVAQVAPDFLLLDTPTVIPAGPATLVIRVDGEEQRRSIEIVDGGTPTTRLTIRRS